ncbi:MAG: winged helix-turn-helix domain-containing tetratricopeptide repeat protein [Pyrinomonadaceae bacterium]
MQKVSHQIHSFDGFTLDLTRGCLSRGTQEIKLRPKPFDALKYLVENPGRLISKGELIHALWPDTAVTDDSLVQCLMEVRRALGDDSQQIIKTVPRRGYIFDTEVIDNASAQVTTYTEETAGVQVIIEEEETNGYANLRTPYLQGSPSVGLISAYPATGLGRMTAAIGQHRLLSSVIALVAVAILAAASVVYFTRPGAAINSVAVMPLINVGGDPEMEYLADGITESLINNLSRLPEMKVIASSSVYRYKGKETDPQVIGRELGVQAILAGKIVQRGDMLTITVELVDTKNSRHMWGDQYERKMSDLQILQKGLSKQIAEQLRPKLTREDLKKLSTSKTESSEAYQLYLKGDYYLRKRTGPGGEKAVAYFQQALDNNQNYAPAHAGLAAYYLQRARFLFMPPEEAYPKALDAITTALRIDDTLAGAHVTLAHIKEYEWDWSGAEQEYRRAIALNPNVPWVHNPYANYLIAMGRTQEAIAESRQALVLDPVSVNANLDLGLILYFAHQYDEAIEQLQQTIDMDPNNQNAHRNLGLAYEQKKMYDEAIGEFRKVQALSKGEFGEMALGHAYAAAGKRDEALKIIEGSKKRLQNTRVAALKFAVIYAGLGEKDQAFHWLDKAFKEHEPALRRLKVDPYFDNLRSDPRFTDLLRRMKLTS